MGAAFDKLVVMGITQIYDFTAGLTADGGDSIRNRSNDVIGEIMRSSTHYANKGGIVGQSATLRAILRIADNRAIADAGAGLYGVDGNPGHIQPILIG